MKEFKVIKTKHLYSKLPNKLAYAIVSTTYLLAEPGSRRGVYTLYDEDDMFIIAHDINDAHEMLIDHIYKEQKKGNNSDQNK
tara:strand:+ start:275 stop:520 length:246 start_codon:yes stop_codon:yes gene_type:complete